MLAYSITVWYAGCSALERRALQRVINSAQKIVGCPLPSVEDISNSRCLCRAKTILKDSTHPAHHLFDLLPSGRHYRSFTARTTKLKNSFFPRAIRTKHQQTVISMQCSYLPVQYSYLFILLFHYSSATYLCLWTIFYLY
ncbi:hypothetical protein LDENG_00095020 [Lucifuga dentata]|nr:hypothetical protein LDENG_00095020 [Lucifuga dentata]